MPKQKPTLKFLVEAIKTRVMQLPPLERNAQSGKYQHVGYVIVLICVKQLHTSLNYLTADENGLRNYTTVSVKLLDWRLCDKQAVQPTHPPTHQNSPNPPNISTYPFAIEKYNRQYQTVRLTPS